MNIHKKIALYAGLLLALVAALYIRFECFPDRTFALSDRQIARGLAAAHNTPVAPAHPRRLQKRRPEMNAAAYGYYIAPITPGEPKTPMPVSSFLNDAGGLLYDGNIGTGYSVVAGTGSSMNVYGLIDLGSAQTISAYNARYLLPVGSPFTSGLYYSNDGTTWTTITTSVLSGQHSITPVTARYLQVGIYDDTSSGGGTTMLREFYAYDGGGTVYGPPVIPTPPTANLSAAPPGILVPNSSTLTWTTTDATSASIDNSIGAVSTSGSLVVSPTVTTTYTLTATGLGGSATSSATITVTPRREVHLFSSGILVAAGGIPFALLQDIALSFPACSKKLLNDAAWVSRFAVDVGFAEGRAQLTAAICSISPSALVTLIGGSLDTGSIPNILTLSKVLSKMPFTLVATLQDTTGLQQVYTFGQVFCPTLQMPTVASDFAKYNFSMFALPDGSGNIATAAMPW